MEPIRILHVVTEMGPPGGGVATWLRDVLRHADRDRFRMDFLVHTHQAQAFDDEIRSLGSRVLPCTRPLKLWKHARDFLQVVRANGPFDILHCHTLFSGYVIRLAKQAKVPVRIAHSHSDRGGFRVDGEVLRGLFIRWTNRWVGRHATLGLACSRRAAAALFGSDWQQDPRWQLHYYGLDFRPFEAPPDRDRLRAELGIPDAATVLGHVGRFQEQKNHAFLIKVAAEAIRQQPGLRLLLVGDGPLRPVIERQVAELGIATNVVWAGARADVPALMQAAMDVLVLPSRYEGLPLVGLEAQAAGLPCVVPDTIAEELDVVPGLVRRLSLGQPPSAWANTVLTHTRAAPAVTRAGALAIMRASMFAIPTAVRNLETVYREAMSGSRSGEPCPRRS